MFIIAPSLLASDFSNLEREIKKVYINGQGCQYLHLDVMDGVFVKNISFGAPVIASLRKICGIIFDTHLMIVNPIRYVADFIEAGADIITFHYEACGGAAEISETIDFIKSRGKKCGISVKPATPVDVLPPFLEQTDMVLVMSVEPGFGGQRFIEGSLEKIKALREIKTKNNYSFDIEVDGGITLENVGAVKKAGANVIVAGSSIFGAPDTGAAIDKFMERGLEYKAAL